MNETSRKINAPDELYEIAGGMQLRVSRWICELDFSQFRGYNDRFRD